MANVNEVVGSVIKDKLAPYGAIATGGASVVLLVTALSVLDQHGDELNMIRQDDRALTSALAKNLRETEILIEKVRSDILLVQLRLNVIEANAKDPHARADAWTRTQSDSRKERERQWVEENFKRRASEP